MKLLPHLLLLVMLAVLLAATPAAGDVLLREDFDGGGLNPDRWRGSAVVQDGVARLTLHTYDPAHPGERVRGSGIQSRAKFERNSGLEFTARLRMGPIDPGLIAAFYTVRVDEDHGIFEYDEIDVEFLGNWIANLSQARTLLGQFDDFLRGSGVATPERWSKRAVFHPGLDLQAWNTFTIRWLPDQTQWMINGLPALTLASNVPDEAMEVHLSLWKPGPGWTEAWSAVSNPTNDPAADRVSWYEVDYVEVRHLPEPASASVLLLAGVLLATRRR